jgi:hypothetical protein
MRAFSASSSLSDAFLPRSDLWRGKEAGSDAAQGREQFSNRVIGGRNLVLSYFIDD